MRSFDGQAREQTFSEIVDRQSVMAILAEIETSGGVDRSVKVFSSGSCSSGTRAFFRCWDIAGKEMFSR